MKPRYYKDLLAKLLFVADWIYYNGPRCSHYTCGEQHFILWNINDEPMQWVLMQFPDYELLKDVVDNKLQCRTMFKRAEYMWFIEGDEPLMKPIAMKPIEYAELPQENLPREGVFLAP